MEIVDCFLLCSVNLDRKISKFQSNLDVPNWGTGLQVCTQGERKTPVYRITGTCLKSLRVLLSRFFWSETDR